ncbi:TadE/TadG family type IV pilus assembly protein [Altererythrobacter aquiaggeris]|uniref:TadE/TadG family type IV pilus assembly protein n=1 Tax=Aestuarierythrobacter aquiaggeris TaxID=1898396 RepID=UPI003017E999
MTRSPSFLRTFCACRRGNAAAEMALLVPFLVLLLFGGLEMSYYFYSQHQVVKGVRDGARFASRQSFAELNCSGGTASTIPATVETSIKEMTRTGLPSGGTARVPGWVNTDVTVTLSCAATAITTGIYANEDNAPFVTIDATVDYPSLFAGVGVIDSTYSLKASQEAAVMGI